MVGLNKPKYFSGNVGTNNPFQGWSEERKRFFHQYGYDRGPGVIPSGQGAVIRQPKIKEVITETEASDPTPTKKVTTIDFSEADPNMWGGGNPLVSGMMGSDPSWSSATAVNTPSAQDSMSLLESFIPAAQADQQQDIGIDKTMNAIMMAESRGDPNAEKSDHIEDSIGLFQVNWDVWGKGGEYEYLNSTLAPLLNGQPLAREHLFNPEINRAAAEAIRERQGLQAWSTYNDGKYLQFMSEEEDPNLFQRMGSGIVEGIKSAWGEPTTQSGIGFDRQHTAEDPDYTREDAPEGIPQEIYNQLRDNHYFGQELGVTSEPTQDTSLLAGAGPSEAELAEAQARLTNPLLEAAQAPGQAYDEMDVLKPTDPSLRLAEQDYTGGAPDTGRSYQENMTAMALGEMQNQVLFVDNDGNEVRMNDMLSMVMPGGGVAGFTRLTLPMLKNLRPAQLKALWQKFRARGTTTTKTKPFTPRGGKRLKRDKEQWKRFDDLLKNPPKAGWTGKRKAAATIAGVVGADLLIDREDLADMPWPIQKAADEAIELKTKVEEATVEAGRKMKSWGLSLFENPEEHTLTEKIKEDFPGTELGEYGRAGIEEETFDPPPVGLLEEAKPIEVAEMSPADLKDEMIKQWTPYKDAVADMNARDIERTAGEPLFEGLNRIWANFPSDVEGRRDRYLQALGEIYKKVAILNVIAALTNSPSMAPQFMELAAKRFETLEGFRGEERLQKIARGVYFTEDGKFDAPRSKQEAYERAMQFGATAKEASTISGYMEGKEDTDQYYRDDGKGGWKTTRSDTDPGEGWTRGTPSGKSPSATTGAYSPAAIEKKHDLLDRYIDERNEAIASGTSTKTIDYKIRTLRDELDKSGVKESRSDLFNRLYDKYFKDVSSFGRIPSTAKNFRDWLLATDQGRFQASVHLGTTWEDIIKEHSPQGLNTIVSETEEALVDDTEMPSTRKEAEAYIRQSQPRKPNESVEEYESALQKFLDELGYG